MSLFNNEPSELGLSRTAELENILSEILDLWNQSWLVDLDSDGIPMLTEEGTDCFERAGAILTSDEAECSE